MSSDNPYGGAQPPMPGQATQRGPGFTALAVRISAAARSAVS